MTDSVYPLLGGVTLRPAALGDAPSLAAALTRSRAWMRPWEPARTEVFYTTEGQEERLTGLLADRDAGRVMPWVVADEQDQAVGAFTLSSIERGPFRSGRLGYWVDVGQAGRGLATAAVHRVCDIARDGLGLHRVEAGTVVENTASQRVLAKCGFELFGTAPRYLHIDGAWRDHRLFQRILHDGPPR
ncbi:GNAT family N-acetyltransferase [Streptomyces fulvorobeus]|uniref:GCN5 family N-acetyltransferase n=1 Tax=Streptomyces fulvorobeus TaxID=284028 RepID=A0A7J0C4Y6_9ACTN|nr:GNAT family protein [Streptomyces fulvorobeus]NYE41108.1 ribosomal-protein-alanine N-acetyltransferase [Streptomyces fulvorobeus]GFM97438.1 GCN5 family N-acetyltransferase [Streptomyces fulvorobeus]